MPEITIVTGEQGPPGPPGAQGPAGPTGPVGTQVRFGQGVPSNSTGVDGDIWWDTDNHRVYVRTTGAYVLRETFGVGGGSDSHYIHTQNSASATWVVLHNLGKHPSITVIDSAGDECEGQVHHDSVNQVTITFSAPFAGVAFCN